MNPRSLTVLILFPILITLPILLLAASTARFSASLPLVPAGLILAYSSALPDRVGFAKFPAHRNGYILGLSIYLPRGAAFPQIATHHFPWPSHYNDTLGMAMEGDDDHDARRRIGLNNHISTVRFNVECCGHPEDALPAWS